MSGRSTPSSFKRVFIGDDDSYAGVVPAEDLLHVAGPYGPIMRVSSSATADYVAFSSGARVDVRMHGAVGDGVANDTAAINAAAAAIPATGGVLLVPPGTYKITAPLTLKSRTTVLQHGATIVAAPVGEWPGTNYFSWVNVNYTATGLTDADIAIYGGTIDYLSHPGGNGKHCIYMQCVKGVIISGVHIKGGASSIALNGCDDTLEIGNRLIGFVNCGSDHWAGTSLRGPSNARLIGCYMETTVAAQMVNWNPEPTINDAVVRTAQGFLMTGNTLVSTETPTTPCQIEPLAAGNIVKDVTISGNTFKGVYLVMRGDVRGATISGNTFSDFRGSDEAIAGYTWLGGTPSGVVITGNVVRDALTSAGAGGVIRMESASATIFANTIRGTAYASAAISVGSTAGQIFGNSVEGTPTPGALQTGWKIANGVGNYVGFTDASGTLPRMFCQSDNNFIFQGTGSTGGARNIFSIPQRSDTSDFNFWPPVLFNSTWRDSVTTVTAAGTVIGAATLLLGRISNVTTVVAGVNDGVVLVAIIGITQVVFNTSAAILQVYPNNSGSSTIDALAANAPYAIAAGANKSFTLVASGKFYSNA